jgi:type VI secretion system protein ImpH
MSMRHRSSTPSSTASSAAPAAGPRPGFDAWLRRLAAAPHGHDLYQTLRRIEAAHPHLPRLGKAMRPSDEPVRLSQSSDLAFAPAALQRVLLPACGAPRLVQRVFGLLGPNGPLPLHLTELAHDRAHQNADHGLQRFLDLLGHRFTLLFYRAWAEAQPALGLDRPGDDAFGRRLGALIGIGGPSLQERDAVGDRAKLHFCGRLARHVRDADGLLAWCRSEFDVPVRIEPWRGHWMALAREERTRLRRHDGQRLGRGAVLGASVWDVQHKFRLVVGPLSLARYRAFHPGGGDLGRLRALVRQWVGIEFEWDLQLILAPADVPRLRLDRHGQLGRSAWLGRRDRPGPADDLVIDVERALVRQRPGGATRAGVVQDAGDGHVAPGCA